MQKRKWRRKLLAGAAALCLALSGCSFGAAEAQKQTGIETETETAPAEQALGDAVSSSDSEEQALGGEVSSQGPAEQALTGAVSYLGPEGTYTQEATQRFFGAEGDYRPQKTVADALQEVLNGSCEYAVIPQENTIGGPVYDYLDELLAHEGLSVQGEVELPIRQALLAPEGTKLDEIKIVYSHSQGIIQSAGWLSEHLPSAEIIEVSSTAEGARLAASAEHADCAAVASAGAAAVYGLSVLAENIQQNENNQTRFYVVSAAEADKNASDRMLFTAEGKSAKLPELMKRIEEEGLQLVSIHDRPAGTVLGEYIYLIECEPGNFQKYEKISGVSGFDYHFYGSFSVR